MVLGVNENDIAWFKTIPEGKYYFNEKRELDYSGFSIKGELEKNYSTHSYLEMKLLEII